MCKTIQYLLFGLLVFTFNACTHDADIQQESYHIKASILISDVDYWPQSNDVVLEIYKPSNNFSFKEIVVENPEDNSLTIEMPLLESELSDYEVKLAIRESAVKKIVLLDYGMVQIDGNTTLPQKQLEIVNFKRLQQNLFVSCTICHGEAQNVAADLYLLPDSSYSNLVNVTAVNSSLKRVKPYEPDSSFVLKVMNKEIDFEHTASTNVSAAKKELLRNWILKGALKDNQ